VNIVTENGKGKLVSSGGDPLLTKMWIRTHVPKGRFFADAKLGHRFHLVQKVNTAGLALMSELIIESCQDLIDNNELRNAKSRAVAVDYIPNVIHWTLSGSSRNGAPVRFSAFYQVV
jgi:hypothetical protein